MAPPEAAAAGPFEVTVCVNTFRRPLLLGRLLEALAASLAPSPVFEVVVVDNDARRSAAPAVSASRQRRPELPLRELCEPRQNIALARNRAVAAANGEWIAFIDDDELPHAGWLERLLGCARRQGADGVFGPVTSALPPGAPEWMRRGGFFDRPRHLTGTRVLPGELRTGNALVRRSLLLSAAKGPDPRDADVLAGPFDPRFGLSGGEDSALLGALAAGGARFVWCDEAVVVEAVPPERATAAWLLRRSYGGGNGYARRRLLEDGRAALPELVARGAGALLLSAVATPILAPLGPLGGGRPTARAMKWCCLGAGALGKLTALASIEHRAYEDRAG